MRLCIVPMKPLARAKERLADLLDPMQRRTLALAMLDDVVTAAVSVMDDVWVLNSDEEAARVATTAGATAVPDPDPGAGLNPALNAATEAAIDLGATGVLVLAADCPAVRPADVRALALGPGVAIAPDRTGHGTNALWRMPPDAIGCVYGERSRRAHEALAHVRRVPCAVIPLERVAADVDVPRDLDLLVRMGPGPATSAALESLGYPSARR